MLVRVSLSRYPYPFASPVAYSVSPDVPMATTIKQQPWIPECTPGTVTTLFEGMKATFKDGLVPIQVNVSHLENSSPRVLSLESLLRVTWYEPSRTIWLRFADQQAAERARDLLEKEGIYNKDANGQLVGQPGSTFTLNATGVRPEIEERHLVKALPREAQPMQIYVGPATYGPEVKALDEVRKTIRANTSTTMTKDEECGKRHPFKSCRAFSFDGNPDLNGLAEALDGAKVQALGNTRIWANQVMTLKLSVKAKDFSAKKVEFKSLVSKAWRDLTVKITTEDCADRTTIAAYASGREALSAVKVQVDGLFTKRKTGVVNVQFPNRNHRLIAYVSPKPRLTSKPKR